MLSERHGDATAALPAIQAGEASFVDATVQEPEDRFAHDLSQEAEGRLEALFIDLLEPLEVMRQSSVEH